MAVQAQHHHAHAFPHDARAIRPAALDNKASDSVFLGAPGGGAQLLPAAVQPQVTAACVGTVFTDPRSDLTWNNNDDSGSCFAPRKRARVGHADAVSAGLIMEGQRALLPPVPQALASVVDVQSRILCSGAASTSGRPAGAAAMSHSLLSHLYRHSIEIHALLRIQNERLRAGLQEARRRHVRAVVSAVERAAAQRLRDADADLGRALARNAELDEKFRQMGAEGQAWQAIARNHEDAAAGLRATLDQMLQPPCAGTEGEAEDARSCCFEQDGAAARSEAPGGRAACRSCGVADACVLLLPCRHLCLCGGCEAAVDACPVCAATKNASLHVLLS